MFKVAVLGAIHQDGLALLATRGSALSVAVDGELSAESMAKTMEGAHAVIVRTVPLTAELLRLAPDLRMVSKHGVGVDNIDRAYLAERDIPLTITPDANAAAVAEHTLMLLLVLAKRVFEADAAVRSGCFDWRDRQRPGDLAGRTILIFGLGRIGSRVASLCRAFGMQVYAYDPYLSDSTRFSQAVVVPSFREVLPIADFISLHLPSLPETRSLLGAAEFALLKPGALLVNCARGDLVPEDVLLQALESGRLGGLGLDVFASEPPLVGHPLLARRDVVLTPHSAALSRGGARNMAVQAARHVLDCLDGRLDPQVVVNPC